MVKDLPSNNITTYKVHVGPLWSYTFSRVLHLWLGHIIPRRVELYLSLFIRHVLMHLLHNPVAIYIPRDFSNLE